MKGLVYRANMTFRYIFDKDISLFKKLLLIAGFLYFIFPVDIVPDFIIGLGILDDITVLVFLWTAIRSELNEYIKMQERMKYDESKIIELDEKRKDKS